MTDNKHNRTRPYQRQPVEAPEVDEKFARWMFVAGVDWALEYPEDEDTCITAVQAAIEAWKAQQAEEETK